MPIKCCVPFCKGNYATGPKVSVFSFPKSEELKKKWLSTIQRKSYILTKNSKVCELHFKKADFENEVSAYDEKTGKLVTALLNIRRLKSWAVPSIFKGYPSYCSNVNVTQIKAPDLEKIAKENCDLQNAVNEGLKALDLYNNERKVCEHHFEAEHITRETSYTDEKTGHTLIVPLQLPRLLPEATSCFFPNHPADLSDTDVSKDAPESKRARISSDSSHPVLEARSPVNIRKGKIALETSSPQQRAGRGKKAGRTDLPGDSPLISRVSPFTRKGNRRKILLEEQSISEESDFSEQHAEKEKQQTQVLPRPACSLLSCNQRGNVDEFGRKVSYHTFPKNLEIRIKWLVKIRIGQDKSFSPSKTNRICSKHFCDEDFWSSTFNNQRRLKPSAIPTVFTKGACSHIEELDSRAVSSAVATFTADDSSHNVESRSETILENAVIKTEPLYPISLWEGPSSETWEGNSDPLSKNTPCEVVLLSSWDACQQPVNPSIKVEVKTENSMEYTSIQPITCGCSLEIAKLKKELKRKDEIIEVTDSYLAKLVDSASNYKAIKEELKQHKLELYKLKKENAELQQKNRRLCLRVNEIVSLRSKCTELTKQINPKPFSLGVIRDSEA